MTVKKIDILFKYLPLRISRAVHSLPDGIFDTVDEIRLRRNAPISLTAGRENLVINEDGRLCGISAALRASDAEMDECITRLTKNSLYGFDEFVSKGFIPLAEGGRAGVCGRARLRGGRTEGFADITSVNLRLHRFLPELARPLISEFSQGGVCGTLVCSPPALGKTTFLRSAAYMLSSGKGISKKRVAIADERSEIAVGIEKAGLTDIISGTPKSEAITLFTRTMSPEVIICDEISAEETDAVLEAQNTGISLIASAHCNDPSGLLRRGRMKRLLEADIFPLCVILGYENGRTVRVAKTEEFL